MRVLPPNVPLQYDARLREKGAGSLEGKPLGTAERMAKKNKVSIRDFRPPGGGESWRDVAARSQSFVREVVTSFIAFGGEDIQSEGRRAGDAGRVGPGPVPSVDGESGRFGHGKVSGWLMGADGCRRQAVDPIKLPISSGPKVLKNSQSSSSHGADEGNARRDASTMPQPVELGRAGSRKAASLASERRPPMQAQAPAPAPFAGAIARRATLHSVLWPEKTGHVVAAESTSQVFRVLVVSHGGNCAL
jgi:hypothetical protein